MPLTVKNDFSIVSLHPVFIMWDGGKAEQGLDMSVTQPTVLT